MANYSFNLVLAFERHLQNSALWHEYYLPWISQSRLYFF